MALLWQGWVNPKCLTLNGQFDLSCSSRHPPHFNPRSRVTGCAGGDIDMRGMGKAEQAIINAAARFLVSGVSRLVGN